MSHEFWLERWQNDEIGFHQEDFNPYLTEFCSELDLSPGDTVFVPLCGKTLDMIWLRRRGYRVLGVELAEKACEAFFKENSLTYELDQHANFKVYKSEGITLYCGDFFSLTDSMLKDVKGVFDRGSMVALPEDARHLYVSHLRDVLPTKASMLVVSFEYLQEEMTGPPFMVTQTELDEFYGSRYQVSQLLRKDVLEKNPFFAEQGVTQLYELIYLVKPRS